MGRSYTFPLPAKAGCGGGGMQFVNQRKIVVFLATLSIYRQHTTVVVEDDIYLETVNIVQDDGLPVPQL